LALASVFCLFNAIPLSAEVADRFAGTWREIESKRQLGSMPALRFRTTPSGGLEELRGPEARPMVQPVSFDGKPRELDSGNTIVWKQINPHRFERELRRGGKLMSTRQLEISSDGKTVTEKMDRQTADGKTNVTTSVFRRTSKEPSGLVGTWKLESLRNTIPAQVKYEPLGKNAMRVSNDLGTTYTMTFDSKPVLVSGPAIIPMMVSAKAVDEHTIETTHSREGTVTGKTIIKVSPDGKTLTMSTTNVGPNSGATSVRVFEKL
jgi:hypothetical protein